MAGKRKTVESSPGFDVSLPCKNVCCKFNFFCLLIRSIDFVAVLP